MSYENYPNDGNTNQNQEQSVTDRQAGAYNSQQNTEQAGTYNSQQNTEQAGAYNSQQNTEQARQDYDGRQNQMGYGSYQNRQDQYEYRNYYDERYRGSQGSAGQSYQSQDNGGGHYGNGSGYGNHSGSGSHDGYYGSQAAGADSNGSSGGRRPKKRNSAGKVVAVAALVVAFVAFCGGISWMAVQSLQSVKDTTVMQEEQTAPQEQVQNDTQENTTADSQDSQIASAGEIAEGGQVSAVVTDVTDVVDKVMPSCVSITNSFTQQQQDFWGQTYSSQEQAAGSGIIIGQNDTELLIVSNHHVIDGADTLSVQFIDGENVTAQVKGSDSSVDLAVLAVKLEDIKEETKEAIVIAQMGDSDSLRIGEPAIAIGNSLGYGQSVTTGVISALNRTLEISETGVSNALIQTDAAINPGNSGGALLNIKGEVIGINSNKIGGSVVEGMGYAIPISTAKPIIEELMTHETKSKVADDVRGYLGISCINVTSDLSENFNMPEGIFVAQVYEGTGAERAGLVRGDIITEFDGTTVRSQEELTGLMQYYEAGETVKITIMQGSPTGYQSKEVELTLSTLDELNAGSQQSQQQMAP